MITKLDRRAEQHLKAIRKQGEWIELNIPEEGGNPQLNKNSKLGFTLPEAGISYNDSPKCPSCSSTNVFKDGFELNPYRQHYSCRGCGQGFWQPRIVEHHHAQIPDHFSGVFNNSGTALVDNSVDKSESTPNSHQQPRAHNHARQRLSTAPGDLRGRAGLSTLTEPHSVDSTNDIDRKREVTPESGLQNMHSAPPRARDYASG